MMYPSLRQNDNSHTPCHIGELPKNRTFFVIIMASRKNFKQPTGKVFHNADVKACLSDFQNKYVFVPADKAPSNIIIICKRYYIETLIKELGLDYCSTPTGTSTYISCRMSSEDIVNTHDAFMKSLGIELYDYNKRLP